MRRLPSRSHALRSRVRELERRVGTLERQMEAELAWREQFARVLEHEINNPLQYLSGNIELAMMDVQEAQRALAAAGAQEQPDLDETARGLAAALRGAQRIGDVTRSTTRAR